MKVLSLITSTPNCEPLWRSLECDGHEVTNIIYDITNSDTIKYYIQEEEFDFIVYIGALPNKHPGYVPDIHLLKLINYRSIPMIFLCGDTAEPEWQPFLIQYKEENCFSVMVGIDGVENQYCDLNLLSPINYRDFFIEDHSFLQMQNGFNTSLKRFPSWKNRPFKYNTFKSLNLSYKDLTQLMCQTKICINDPSTGSKITSHVKGRIIEAAYAGCCLLEKANSPTSNWFTPGEDYLEYSSIDEAVEIINTIDDELAQKIARSLHLKVMCKHIPEIFWSKVLCKNPKVYDLLVR